MNGAAWGGSEEGWYQTAKYCAANGFEVGVCCFFWKAKTGKLSALNKAGCKLWLIPGKEQTKKRPLTQRNTLLSAVRKIPFESYDLIIVNQGGWKDIAYSPFRDLYTRFKKYILLFHNYNPAENLSLSRKLVIQNWVNKSSKNLGASLKIFEVMENRYGIAVPNKNRLFNPLTIPVPGQPPPYPPLHKGNFVFSVLAALDVERKAQDVLIKTLAIDPWQDRNWELHIYGEGKDRAALASLIIKLGMQHKIFLHGNAANYQQALKASHLILQVTHIDAMPVTVIEAMSMARPLVVSAVGDMPLWIKEKINGWIALKAEQGVISAVMEKAWSNRGQWEEMGKRSFDIFKQQFPENPVEYFLKQCNIV